MKLYFEIECRVYAKIFEEYNAIGECHWRPKYYLLRDDCLVLENLRDCGYINKTLYGNGLNQQHIECLLTSLAELHANSFASERRGINLVEKYETLLRETRVTSESTWFTYEMEVSAISRLIAACKN